MAGGVALQFGVGRTLGQTVAEHLRHIIVLIVAGLLLHEGRQSDHLGEGHPLLFHLGIHLIGDLLVEVRIERLNVMMDGVILQEIVGIREKITLALEEAVRGVLVVGDVLPEPVLAEIAGVGLLEEVFGAAQPGILHFFRNGDGRRTFGEGQPDAVGLRVGGERLDDVVVGAAGGEVELAVLELACRALLACIPAEDVGVLDDARRLELLGDGCHAAALLDAHTHRFAGGSTAVDLFSDGQQTAARRQYQDQQHD